MTTNLLKKHWIAFDSYELRLALDEYIGGYGQHDDTNCLSLPSGSDACFIKLKYHKKNKNIIAIEPGPLFIQADWEIISKKIEKSILECQPKIARGYSFCSFRVLGSWRGINSGLQILPPYDDAPRAKVEMADHPFILEFPIMTSDLWAITNHRRLREHHKLTLLLNILLAGRTSLLPRQTNRFWAIVSSESDTELKIEWVSQYFFANLSEYISHQLSETDSMPIEEISFEIYYANIGHDGKALRIPDDLDESIVYYRNLSESNRAKFDRALFWADMAVRQWNISVSASFAALVSAIESLTERGERHNFICPVCNKASNHEIPGPTQLFRDFFKKHTSDIQPHILDAMYNLRSGILHGNNLMDLDMNIAFGADPPWWNEYELHNELWKLTFSALRHWLKNCN